MWLRPVLRMAITSPWFCLCVEWLRGDGAINGNLIRIYQTCILHYETNMSQFACCPQRRWILNMAPMSHNLLSVCRFKWGGWGANTDVYIQFRGESSFHFTFSFVDQRHVAEAEVPARHTAATIENGQGLQVTRTTSRMCLTQLSKFALLASQMLAPSHSLWSPSTHVPCLKRWDNHNR